MLYAVEQIEREVRERLAAYAHLVDALALEESVHAATSAWEGLVRGEAAAPAPAELHSWALDPLPEAPPGPRHRFPGLPADPVAAVAAALAAIGERGLDAFTYVDADGARARAAELAGVPVADRGPLHGLPIAIKDNIEVAGWPVTAGSAAREDVVATTHAPVVRRLHDAGAILIGLTNMDELAWGATTTNQRYGRTLNPIAHDRSVGGSSGGSAAAVAAGIVLAAIGTDTGGSVRLPAASTGVVGFRPSTGFAETDGVVPLAESYDVVGPIATTVAGARALAETLSGRCLPATPVIAPRLGVITDLTPYGTDPEVSDAVDRATNRLLFSGAEIVPVRVDGLREMFDVWFVPHLVEPFLAHRALISQRGTAMGTGALTPLLAGAGLPEELVPRAQALRAEFIARLDAALADVDVVVAPTLAFAPPRIGDTAVTLPAGETPIFRAMPTATWLASMAGLPAVSIPLPTAGLPVGYQVMGRRGDDARVLAIAEWIERINRKDGSV